MSILCLDVVTQNALVTLQQLRYAEKNEGRQYGNRIIYKNTTLRNNYDK